MSDLFEKATNDSCCPNLSLKTRMIGFVICLIIGCILSLVSLGSLMQLIKGHPNAFAIYYSIGNIISILSYLLYFKVDLYF